MMIGRVIRRRMSSRHVAVVGSVCVDSFIGVPRLPSSGETLVRRVVLFFRFLFTSLRRFISTFSLQESRNLLTKTGLERSSKSIDFSRRKRSQSSGWCGVFWIQVIFYRTNRRWCRRRYHSRRVERKGRGRIVHAEKFVGSERKSVHFSGTRR